MISFWSIVRRWVAFVLVCWWFDVLGVSVWGCVFVLGWFWVMLVSCACWFLCEWWWMVLFCVNVDGFWWCFFCAFGRMGCWFWFCWLLGGCDVLVDELCCGIWWSWFGIWCCWGGFLGCVVGFCWFYWRCGVFFCSICGIVSLGCCRCVWFFVFCVFVVGIWIFWCVFSIVFDGI